jgi:hypothetical protein
VPKISFKDGVLTADSYVKAAGEWTCAKGTTTKFTMDWPEGVVSNGTLTLGSLKCGCCGEVATYPAGKHYAKDGVLVHEYTNP